MIGFINQKNKPIWLPEELLAGIPSSHITMSGHPLILVPLTKAPYLSIGFYWLQTLSVTFFFQHPCDTEQGHLVPSEIR